MNNRILIHIMLFGSILYGYFVDFKLAISITISFCLVLLFAVIYSLNNDEILDDVVNGYGGEPDEELVRKYSGMVYILFSLFLILTIALHKIIINL